jgi:hypothetical protein
MSDEQLAETMTRFLNGESLEAIARSQGLPWTPWPPCSGNPSFEVTENDLREGILALLEVEDVPSPCREPQDKPTGATRKYRRSNLVEMTHEAAPAGRTNDQSGKTAEVPG